jgi:transcriptional regulator with XRE-family HTH domain
MEISDHILSIIERSPDAIIKGIARRVKERRLEMALTQQGLAKRAGIPLPTYRRFERTGEISIRALVMLGVVMGMTEEFTALFTTQTYSSIDELLKSQSKKHQRGRKNE